MSSSEPKWLKVALSEVGEQEIAGEKDNPRIVEYHAATKLQATADETPWCSSFCNWVFAQCGIQGTGSAMARSWVRWGQRLENPVYGCVVVLARGSQLIQGHVGFCVGVKNGLVEVLGGNQGNKVCIEAFPRTRVVAYRWPKNETLT